MPCWPRWASRPIKDLGANKFFAFAGVLVALEGKTG